MAMSAPVLTTILVLLASPVLEAQPEPLFRYDFEQGTNLATYAGVDVGKTDAAIVEGGPDGDSHCLRISTRQPERYCQVSIKRDMVMQKNLTLSFDHREEIEEGKPAAYLGVLFFDAENKQWFGSDKFTPQWRHVEIAVGDMHSPNQGVLTLGKVLDRLNLYGRAQGETMAHMTVWLDNIMLSVRPREGGVAEGVQVSYSNPPLFNWPGGEGTVRLEYSQDPGFPPGGTVRVETTRNYHTPEQPLEAGDWQWRVWVATDLSEGYTDTRTLRIEPEAHRFTTSAVPVARLTASPHPRLARPEPAMPADRRAALLKRAEDLARQGVPDDPPPYEEGNPQWPTWIEWYGKVHGKITSATGRRLEDMGRIYAQTREPRVRDLLKPLALKAATWDPTGGSAMGRGDIGAHHFLRGLNWCYDSLYDDLSEQERWTLRDIIVRRGDDFWKALNPFPGNGSEFNNHSWLKAFGLAESGLVLLGDCEQAGDWAEYVRQLYLGKFLCGLGYQGDNNEGISYWSYGLSFIIRYADMMREVCDLDLYRHPWLAQTARFPLYSAPPGAWAVSFADTGQPNHGVRGPAVTGQVRELALRTQDPYALWYSGTASAAEGLQPRPPVDLAQSIHYRFIGWALHNTSLVDGREGVTFAMRSGKFWAGHQHEDQNSFVIHAYGEKLAIDGGHYDWYGSKHFNEFSTLTRAHNAILVNGRDQDSRKRGADGRIAAYFDSPAYGYTVGSISGSAMYQGQLAGWDRRALFIKPGFVVIHDLLAAAERPARYDWLLHTVADIQTSAESQSFSLTSKAASLRGRFLAPEVGLEVHKGYPVEPVMGYSTNPVPPERYVDEWTLTATPAQPRLEEGFLVALQVSRAGAAEAAMQSVPVLGGLGARLSLPDQTCTLISRARDAEGELSGGGVATDGELAAVCLDVAGTIHSACAAGARVLTFGEMLRLTSDVPADFSLLQTEAGVLLSCLPREASEGGVTVSLGGRTARVAFPDLDAEGNAVVRFPGVTDEVAAATLSHQLPPVPVGQGSLQGYARRKARGLIGYWWGQVIAERADEYRLTLNDWRGKRAPALTVDGRTVALDTTREDLQAVLCLDRGAHSITLTGEGRLGGLALEGSGLRAAEAILLPLDYAPIAGSIVIEAETPVAEGEVKGLIVEKVAASGGVANCSWDTDGQWAEWEFSVEQAGAYNLLLRAAGEYDDVLRSIKLDGGPLADNVLGARFCNTGGWCRTTDDWRFFRVARTYGMPAVVELSAGTHRLRLQRIGGSMNIDQLIWEPAG